MYMILFVSGRCDIPAFFSPWFYNRLKEGYVDVRNPYNEHQISRIILHKDYVDCILFCTKNPLRMMERLDEIYFPYIFHITLTPYHQDIEVNMPNKKDILHGIELLSSKLGKERVVIRYDPIILTPFYTTEYHIRAFEKLCMTLQGSVYKIIISFVDMYKNTKHNMEKMEMLTMGEKDIHKLASAFGMIAKAYGMHIQTCAEEIDLSLYNIEKGLCINQKEIEHVIGHSIIRPKGKGVRISCDCMPSVDIGDYNCCMHQCLYCYANYNEKQIQQRVKLHNPNSSVLLGEITDMDNITIRERKKIKQIQLL